MATFKNKFDSAKQDWETPQDLFDAVNEEEMACSEPEVPPLVVQVKDKPKLIMPDGREVIVRKPIGFANHPAVPPQKKGSK